MQVAPGESLWAVLMRESVFGPKRLELFHRYTDYSDSRPPCVILDLSDMLHVERDLEATPVNLTRSQPFFTHVRFGDEGNTTSRSLIPQLWHQFTISTEEEALVFATRTGEESSLWVGKLNELLHGPPERGIECEFHSVYKKCAHDIMLPQIAISCPIISIRLNIDSIEKQFVMVVYSSQMFCFMM